MKKILIPNATSPQNTGDLAMMEVLIDMLRANFPQAEIVVHSYEPHRHSNAKANKITDTLYYWTAFKKKGVVNRIHRLGIFGYTFFKHQFSLSALPQLSPELETLFNDYKTADMIVFVGGGYLRTNKGLSQTINLFMLLSHFATANKTKAKKIVAPISFGPFAHKWQEKLSANVVSQFDVMAVREDISQSILKPYSLKNLVLSTDHGLMLKNISPAKPKDLIVGFTIRNWSTPQAQATMEQSYEEAIANFAKKHKATVQPIIQVDAPEYGDLDVQVTEKIVVALKKRGISVLPLKKVIGLDSAKVIYGSITLLIGMRMHSNIIAATQGTPFVAVSYEHKTEGIAKQLGLEDYVIRSHEITAPILEETLEKLLKHHEEATNTMNSKLAALKEKEYGRWLGILSL
jgi:colanic acid/amylovoran biosynthesis protein